MSFSAKLLTYSAVASILMGTSPILMAEPISIEYEGVTAESAEAVKLWGDILPNVEMQGDWAPSIFVAKFGSLTVTTMYASNMCSMMYCPLRAFEGDVKIVDTMACNNVAAHQIADSHKAMVACDDVILLNNNNN